MNTIGSLQKLGEVKGTVELELYWQGTYIPPKASTKTQAQVMFVIEIIKV